MGKLTILASIFFFFGYFGAEQRFDGTAKEANVRIQFQNIQKPEGYIRLALYQGEEVFLDEEKAVLYSFQIKESGNLEAELKGLAFGEYAIAAFHDLNADLKLETNFFGIPTEPYGFSGTSRSKWRPPTFEEARFIVSEQKKPLKICLEKWKL